MDQITIEELMEQAQVFARAWALVDTPYDKGTALENANGEMALLEEMLQEFRANEEHQLKTIATGLVEWHQALVKRFRTVLGAPADTEIQLNRKHGEPIVLSGDHLAGARIGLTLALEWIEKFPLRVERDASEEA